MRWLKLIVSGLFALLAVTAGLVVTAVVVTIAFVIAALNRLSGRPSQPVRPAWPRTDRRVIKQVAAADVTVTDVPSVPKTIPAPVDSAT